MESTNLKARVRRDYKTQYPNPIQVKAGESVHVGRADNDDPGWRWCRAADGREGWMPVELLSSQDSPAIVLRNYSAKELAVHLGEQVEIEEIRHRWVLVRNAQGELGWIPQSHLEI